MNKKSAHPKRPPKQKESQGQSLHTPGPWFVGAMNDALFVINEPPRPAPTDYVNTALKTKVIAKPSEPHQSGVSREEYQANARLIAAAPELLEACRGLLFCIGSFAQTGSYPTPSEPEIKAAQAAYPVRVEMRRMTQKESTKKLATMRAILATLMKVEAAGSVAEAAVRDMQAKCGVSEVRAPRQSATAIARLDNKLARIMPTLNQVHICAREHAKECIHCDSIARVLDEVFHFTNGTK